MKKPVILKLSDCEEALRDMAYNGGPFTYYGVLKMLRSVPPLGGKSGLTKNRSTKRG